MVGTGVGNTPILGGKGTKSFNQMVKLLFANGEKGFAYDPSDMTTLTQDGAGNIPVTALTQDVGMILDKSKGLAIGPELFVKFDSTFSATMSKNTPPCVITSTTDVGVYGAVGSVTLQAGTYKIEFSWSGNTNGSEMMIQLPDGNNLNLGKAAAGVFSRTMRFAAAGYFSITKDNPNVGQTFTVNHVTIKKIEGAPAFQTNMYMRPRLQDNPRRLAFDAVNDKLVTTLPAQLTGCTVIRAVPAVGIQMLTNQTIPVSFEDLTNHCGLIVINRPLTTREVNQLTKLFNKLAK